MKESVKKGLIELAKTVLNAIIAFVTAITVASCGSTTKAVISNRAESTTTTVTITTNNPSNWDVSPDTNVEFLPRN